MLFALIYLLSSIWAAYSVLAHFLPFPFPRLTRIFLAIVLSFPISAWLTLFSAAALRETTPLSTCLVPSAFHLGIVFWAKILSERRDRIYGKSRTWWDQISEVFRTGELPTREEIADKLRVYLFTRDEIHFIITLMVFGIPLSYLYYHHSLSDNGTSYFSGGSTWADVAIHATFIHSMAHGVNSNRPFWDFESPIFSGERLVYPFLIEVQSLALLKGGFSLNQCIWIPSALLAISMLAFLYLFAFNFSNGNRMVGVYAILLTLCAGGIGFINLFRDAWERGNWLPPLQHDYVLNIAEKRQTFWFGFVAHIILPQRTSLSAYPLFLGALVLMQHAVAPKKTALAKEDPYHSFTGMRLASSFKRLASEEAGSLQAGKASTSSASSAGSVSATGATSSGLLKRNVKASSKESEPDASTSKKDSAALDTKGKYTNADQDELDSDDRYADEDDADYELDDDEEVFEFVDKPDSSEVIIYTPFFPASLPVQSRTPMFVITGVLAGFLPFCTAHVYLGLAAYCGFQVLHHPRFFLDWTLTAIIAGVMGLPQLLSFSVRASKWGFLQLKPAWNEAQETVPELKGFPEPVRALLFWPFTLGVFFVLSIVAIAVLNNRQRINYLGFLCILGAGTVFQFQPWNFDNIKLLYLWYFGAAVAVGVFLERLRQVIKPRIIAFVIIGVLVVLSIAAGAASIRREFHEHHVLLDKPEREVSDWVVHNTPPRALFVHAQHHNHAITNLAGRRTLVGFQGWLWSHGFDYYPRVAEFDAIWHGRDGWEDAIKKYHVDYIVTGPYWSEPQANVEFMDRTFHKVYNNQFYNVYKVPDQYF